MYSLNHNYVNSSIPHNYAKVAEYCIILLYWKSYKIVWLNLGLTFFTNLTSCVKILLLLDNYFGENRALEEATFIL